MNRRMSVKYIILENAFPENIQIYTLLIYIKHETRIQYNINYSNIVHDIVYDHP